MLGMLGHLGVRARSSRLATISAVKLFIPIGTSALLLSSVACTKRELPKSMLGEYSRPEIKTAGMSLADARLYVTKGGLTVTALQLSTSLDILGMPVLGQKVGMTPTGSAIFAGVRCDDDTCTFTTK